MLSVSDSETHVIAVPRSQEILTIRTRRKSNFLILSSPTHRV